MIKKWVAVVLVLCLLMPFRAAAQVGELSSLSAVLYEPQSGRVLYAKDPDTKRPMASTTKLMTALVASECVAADRVVTVPAAALLTEGSSMGLKAGDTLSMRDLLSGMLLTSGNDAANAVALLTAGSLTTFAELMNRKAASLGMTNSVFVTPSGLDAAEHGSTAYDMALLGAAVLRSPLVSELCAQQRDTITVSDCSISVTNHNRLLTLFKSAIGLKTGFTKKSGRCLVSAARRDGVTLVIASLNGGDYWNDHIALYDYGFSKTVCVSPQVPTPGDLPVIGGEFASVSLAADTPDPVVLLQGESVFATVELPAFVWAPLALGDAVGRVVYHRNDGTVVGDSVVRTAQAVAERPPQKWITKWWRQLSGLLTALTE